MEDYWQIDAMMSNVHHRLFWQADGADQKKHSSTWEAQCKIKTSPNKCINAKITKSQIQFYIWYIII